MFQLCFLQEEYPYYEKYSISSTFEVDLLNGLSDALLFALEVRDGRILELEPVLLISLQSQLLWPETHSHIAHVIDSLHRKLSFFQETGASHDFNCITYQREEANICYTGCVDAGGCLENESHLNIFR